MTALRVVFGALVPALLFAALLYRSDKSREPRWLVAVTFVLGVVTAMAAFVIQLFAARATGLDVRVGVAGNAGALVFLFGLVAPVRESAKVVASWVAFRTRHFDEPYDGVVYAGVSALGFAAAENVFLLRDPDGGNLAIARALLGLPAHLFFAALWGYALGRAKLAKRPGLLFPVSWTAATLCHGLYLHLLHGRGSGALLATVPLLLFMGAVAFLAARDLAQRGDRNARVTGERLSRVTGETASGPPSLRQVREAFATKNSPIKVRWIALGVLVTLGAMVFGLGAAVVFAWMFHVDFSLVDEHDVSTTGPIAILGVGVLSAFPVSGYLVSKASGARTLLEPALAAAFALLNTLVFLGFAAPVLLVFALSFAPIAWGLACAGAWVGRPDLEEKV